MFYNVSNLYRLYTMKHLETGMTSVLLSIHLTSLLGSGRIWPDGLLLTALLLALILVLLSEATAPYVSPGKPVIMY